MTAKQKPIDTLHISEARFVAADGKTVLVQPALAEEYLRPGRVAYDRDQHYKKLLCPHCDVRVDFNKGSGIESCGANVIGARPHFKKAPKQAHAEDCRLPKIQHDASDSEIDDAAGFRIHLNKSFGAKPEQVPVYKRIAGGKIESNDSRLKPYQVERLQDDGSMKTVDVYRESLVARAVEDFIDIMRRGQKDRLRNSVVVNNTVVNWDQFAILNDRRLRGLVDRLRNGASHPVLLRVGVYAPVAGADFQSGKVFYERDDRGASFIIPHIWLDGKGLEDAFPDRGEYLVLGLPRVKFNRESGAFMLNLSVKGPEFVAPYFESQLADEAKAHDEKRRAHNAGPTPA